MGHSGQENKPLTWGYNLLPLNTLRFLLSLSVLPDLQPSEHSDPLRHTAARHWDSTGTNTETQTKPDRVEFRFLSQSETGWGGVIRNPPLAPPTCKPLAVIPVEYLLVVLRYGMKRLVSISHPILCGKGVVASGFD